MRRLVIWLLIGLAGFALGRAMAGAPEPARSAPRRESPEAQPAPRDAPVAEPETSWVDRTEGKAWAIQVAQVGREMRAHAPVARIETTYRGIREPLRRWHFVRGLIQNGPCPFLHDVIRWMQEDPDPELRRRALQRIRHLSFRDFEDDPEGLREWQDKYASRPPRDAYLDGMESFATRLRSKDETALAAVFREYPDGELEFNWNAARVCGLHLRDAARQTGLTDALVQLAGDEGRHPELRRKAFRMLAAVDPGADLLEPIARVALDHPDLHTSAREALVQSSGGWVAPVLFEDFRNERDPPAIGIPWSLARCDDERAFPMLIARVVARPDDRNCREALNQLTDAEHLPPQDGDWWLDWWRRNSHRFGEAARSIDVLALAAREGK